MTCIFEADTGNISIFLNAEESQEVYSRRKFEIRTMIPQKTRINMEKKNIKGWTAAEKYSWIHAACVNHVEKL